MKPLSILKATLATATFTLFLGVYQVAQAAVISFDSHSLAGHSKGGGKSEAAAKAQAQYGGKVLSVNASNSGGQVVYKVKLLLDSGRIKIVSIKGR